MNEKISLRITTAIAAYTRDDAPRDLKLEAARSKIPLSPIDRATLLVILSQNRDPEIKQAAIASLKGLPQDEALEIASHPDAHPRILDIIARLHQRTPAVVAKLLANPSTPDATRASLQADRGAPPSEPAAAPPVQASPGEPGAMNEPDEAVGQPGEEEPVEEETEEFKSKYQLAQTMGVSEKIKMALTGDKEWRSLLIKDSNKLVSGAVIKNPRITEPEVLAIVKGVVQNDEILRVICMNKEWIKNYEIRKGLALNNKTALPNALRYLATLSEKDLASVAKSKNVSAVLSTQARRILNSKKKN